METLRAICSSEVPFTLETSVVGIVFPSAIDSAGLSHIIERETIEWLANAKLEHFPESEYAAGVTPRQS